MESNESVVSKKMRFPKKSQKKKKKFVFAQKKRKYDYSQHFRKRSGTQSVSVSAESKQDARSSYEQNKDFDIISIKSYNSDQGEVMNDGAMNINFMETFMNIISNGDTNGQFDGATNTHFDENMHDRHFNGDTNGQFDGATNTHCDGHPNDHYSDGNMNDAFTMSIGDNISILECDWCDCSTECTDDPCDNCDEWDRCYEDDFEVSNECDEPVDQHLLYEEVLAASECEITGNRIVDLNNAFEDVKRLNRHSKKCDFNDMILQKETKFGYKSNLYFECMKCGYVDVIRTAGDKTSTVEPDINYAAVLGAMSIGSTFSHLEEFSSLINVPPITRATYYRKQHEITKDIQIALDKNFNEVMEDEISHAREMGQINEKGTPHLKVYGDAAWCKRSYRSSGHSCLD